MEVDLAAFLPEGVSLDVEADVEAQPGQGEVDLAPPDGGPREPSGSRQDGIDTELLDSVERDLADVDAALRAIDQGAYGTCLVCAAVISEDLLGLDPVRRTCEAHP